MMKLATRHKTTLLSLCFCSVSSLAADVDASKSLEGTWRFVSFQSMSDEEGTKKPLDTDRFVMMISPDGRVAMELGCNRAMGNWQATPSANAESGQFSFGPLAGTRALCPPPALDELITGQSSYVRGYLLEGNSLHLSLMADGGIFTWDRISGPSGILYAPVSPDEGGPQNWQVNIESGLLNLRAQPSVRSEILSQYAAGAVLDNLGCSLESDRTWCDVQALGGGARGYVAADYLVPAISPNGHALFGPDDSALRAGMGIFDATGELPCMEAGERCAFGVARSGGGYATVVVTLPSGRDRILYFRMGRAIGASTSEADNPGVFTTSKSADTYEIYLGQERFEIPDAVVLGG